MRHRRQPGFTLVELLVVISIIALLISILLPSMKKARDQAKRTVCASQLRQVGNAMWSYWTESNGRIPFVVSPMTNGTGSAPEGGTMPGFGDDDVEDDEIDPFHRREKDDADEHRTWPMSLANILMPTYLGSEEGVFSCPAALIGWPRNSDRFRMTYRPAAANQINGSIPTAEQIAASDFDYMREHFGFMDGRMYDPPKPVKFGGDDVQSIIRVALESAAQRGTFLRDLVVWQFNKVKGPHGGGNNVINKRMEVEFRDQDRINEDLAPNGQRSVEF